MFYGLPIHIMRDLFMTARSFTKRLAAFLRYRRATHDMNNKYEDATVEDIQREDTCIICREEMRPWSVTNPAVPPAAPGAAPPARPATTNERSRPKKLPCGHILHLGCLKSWLERQQVCPTCRRPVVDRPAVPGAANANPAQGAQPPVPGQQDGPGAPPPAAGRDAGRGMRMLNLGPLRVGFGQANLRDLAQGFGNNQQVQDNPAAAGPRVYGLELGFPRLRQPQPQGQGTATNVSGPESLPDHLQQIERHIMEEIRSLQVAQSELQLVQLLQAELARLRLMQNEGADPLAANLQMPQMPQLGPLGTRNAPPFPMPTPQMQRHGVRPNTAAIPAGSADLPPGVTIPEGWTLLPLQRLDGPTVTQTGSVPVLPTGPAANLGSAPTATTQPARTISPTIESSNNTLTPTPTVNPENQSQTSSVDSSDTNAIHTPPSISADQSNISVVNTTNTASQSTATSNNAPESLAMSTSDPPVLPNWGSSQLFSGPSRAVENVNTAESSSAPPPLSGEGQSSTVVGSSDSALSGERREEDADAEESKQNKGKGRAATVEDTIDEAEGA
jgi:E3 ubiquitin-protein ligase synoviolin